MIQTAFPVLLTVPANRACFTSPVEIVPDHTYLFKVTGKWVDFNDPPVNANGNVRPKGVRQLLGWAKRLPAAPWMALLIRSKGINGTSAWRWIKDGTTILTDQPQGMLQLCSNDVLGFYWNNSKELEVIVIDVTKNARLG